MMSPSLVTAILKHEKQCDFTSFDTISIGGGKVYKDILIALGVGTYFLIYLAINIQV